MTEERNGQLSGREQDNLPPVPQNETPVSSDNRRMWLLAIGVLAVLAVLAGNTPRTEQSPDFNPAGISNLVVEARGVNVVFEDAQGTDIEAQLTGSRSNDVTLVVTQSAGTLDVSVQRRFAFFRLFSFGQPTLRVSLPAGFDADIRAETSSGRIQLHGLGTDLAEVSLEASSGRISVQDTIFVGDMQLRTSSGRISVQNVEVSGRFEAVASSGLVELVKVDAAEYNLQTSSGRITADGLSGAAVTARTSSGRLEVKAVTILADWDIRASSGRVTIELEQPPADLSVDFRGGSGRWSVAQSYGFGTSDTRRNSLVVPGSGPQLSVRTSSGRFELL